MTFIRNEDGLMVEKKKSLVVELYETTKQVAEIYGSAINTFITIVIKLGLFALLFPYFLKFIEQMLDFVSKLP